MNGEHTSTPHESDPYAAFRINAADDMGVRVTVHRGGGGGMGGDGSVRFVCDTMSTEHYGFTRTLTEQERALLDDAVRALAKVLVAIRDRS